MNKLPIYFILLLFFGISSCKKDTVNQSKLRFGAQKDFIVKSIEQGSGSEIFCVGKIRDTDSIVVLRYDRNLKLIESINLTKLPDFQGIVKLTHLKSGWIICKREAVTDRSILTIMITDEMFNITRRKIVYNVVNTEGILPNGEKKTFLSGLVLELKPLQNGDFLMVWDTANYFYYAKLTLARYTFGIRITRLSPELNTVFSFSGGSYGQNINPWNPSFPRAVELTNGDIFYTIVLAFSGYQTYGLLDKDGNLKYQKVHESEFWHERSYGLSLAGDNVIFPRIVNDEGLLFYTMINPKTGDKIKEIQLDQGYQNKMEDEYDKFYYFYQVNPLPDKLDHNSGQVLLAVKKGLLVFNSVDQDLNVAEKFSILLPESAIFNSYRQLFTRDGTIIVGCSINTDKGDEFVIQELTMDGKVVN